MLSSRDAFKVGFLSRCVEEGLTLEEAHERVKEAMDKMGGIVGDITSIPVKALEAGKAVAAPLLSYGLPLAIAAPPILGGVAGYGLAKATDVDDQDPEEVKKQEVADEYRRQTARLLRQRAMREYRARRKQTGRVFL